MGAKDGIKHVIVLMLENRSFDCMLGKLRESGPGFAGLTGNESNPLHQIDGVYPIQVWPSTAIDDYSAKIPDPDPGEFFVDMNQQLFGADNDRIDAQPSMRGFVENYIRRIPPDKPRDPVAVMHYFTPEQLPVLSTLAKAFGVCDQWHASAPCQTWPNRFFAHTGTSCGYVNNHDFPIPFPAPSIFKKLSDNNRSWRVYFHDLPQSIMLGDVWYRAFLHYRFFGQFLADVQGGNLPDYSFIEPRYFGDLGLGAPNDQHPPSDVRNGEKLIAEVYNAIRSSRYWKQSLLIITYDEHGGCYDHVPPPKAISPDGKGPPGFPFNTYGVRVPAVIISPYMARGSVVRSAPAGTAYGAPPYPFDHTSIIRTLHELFGLPGQLTNRDAAAPSLLGALSLENPTNDGPSSVAVPKPDVSRDDLRQACYAPPNHLQDLLARMSRALPVQPGVHQDAVASQRIPDIGFATVLEAGLHAVARVKTFLGL